MKRALASVVLLLATAANLFAQAQWVHFGTNGTLAYYTDNVGNRLPDFSFAGYEQGGVALPVLPVKQTIGPIAGDNTVNIQNAINAVGALAADANGFRGAVLLEPGTYTIAGTLTMSASGVVLRGSGNNTNTGTVLLVTGNARNVITVGGSGSWSQVGGTTSITDNYVPLGATNFSVSNMSGFAVGNSIVVQRPQTVPWIDAIGMNLLTDPWTSGSGLRFERQITAINGNQITIDVPLCNPIESVWTTGEIFRVTDTARIQQVGIENLCGVGQISDYPSNILTGCFIVYQNLKQGWAHDIYMSGWGNGISLNSGCKWCTVQDCQYAEPGTGTSSAAPAAYTIGSSVQMCLFQRCTSDGGYYHIMVTQDSTAGPDVFLNFTASGTHYNGGPHQRWAAGILHDNINMAADSEGDSTPYLAINNRGNDGSGQGWGAGFSVMYNCQVPQFQLEQPATTTNEYNWTIGGIGSVDNYSDKGIYDTLGTIVSPRSLYLEQLKERLGPAAVQNIGYAPFVLSATPSAQSVLPGGNASFTVSIVATNNFADTVSLNINGVPSGAVATLSTNTVSGSGSATLAITTSNTLSAGIYPLTLSAVDGNLTNSISVNLVVGTFALAPSPSSQSVIAGQGNISYTINLTTNTGFSGNVSFGVGGLPTNTAASFNPAALSDAGSSTLTLTVSNNAPSGNFTLTITGTNGGTVSATSVELIVTNLSNPLWNGGSASDSDWSDAANWSGLGIAAGDSLPFGGVSRLLNTNDTPAGTAYSGLLFDTGAGAFVLNGNPITLTGGITNNSSNPQTLKLGLNFSSNISLNGTSNLLLIGGGLTNTFSGAGFTSLTLSGSGILTNLLGSTTSPGGTNLILLNDPNANWTLMDNSSGATMTAPWVIAVNEGTFNFGSAASAPKLTTTTPNNVPQDNQVGSVSGTAGTFNMFNGTLTTSARLNTATAAGATGTVNQSGGTMNIGSQFQGANGSNPGEVSLVNVTGGTMNIGSAANPTSPFYVASRGTGTLTVSGSGAVNCGTLDVSRNANGNSIGSVGTVNLNGGKLTVNRIGTATANAQTGLNAPSATFNFNGGTLKAGASSANFIQGSIVAPVIPISVIVKSGGAIIDDGGHAITILEPMQHDAALGGVPDGGLVKLDTGTLTLAGTNTYTGNTKINVGALALTGSGSIAQSAMIVLASGASLDASGASGGSMTLMSGQTLTGVGIVKGTLNLGSGATLAPGNPSGALSFSNSLNLLNSSITVMSIDKSSATNTMIQSAGSLIYGGTLYVTNTSAVAFAFGDAFKLFNAASYSGAFSAIIPATPGNGLVWDTSTLTNNGTLRVIGPPRFDSFITSNSSLMISGSGGVPGTGFRALTSTNASLPFASWTQAATGSFDANGNFNFTAPINPTLPQSYYVLVAP